MFNNYTLCIPRVCKTIKKTQIIDVLNKYQFGKIKKIDIIENKGKNTNIVHIYYSYWYKNDYVDGVIEKLTTRLNIKIFYDDPWFWIVYLHKPSDKTRCNKDKNNNNYKQKYRGRDRDKIKQKRYFIDNQ